MQCRPHATQAASSPGPAFPFTPVPVRPRHDGWTPDRQAAFIHALAETACVDEACRRVGLSQQSAYKLRDRPDAGSFRRAWAEALDRARPLPDDGFAGRALTGIATPIMYQGRQVGERRRFDNRLAMYILRLRLPARPGAFADKAHPTRATGALAARRADAADLTPIAPAREQADGQLSRSAPGIAAELSIP